ncbi:Ribosome biogenesis protein WDR12 [Chionoecetes opilio]|uniref:Ribosome biogenesis protein WDR12 n=1 Tax=Chionoecetes opilio TaxID=41210 RepID=A0A8J5CNE6_CHIOP|nr:Ribosome biogenesis protein WDR12 [Chionoecetes opilio]
MAGSGGDESVLVKFVTKQEQYAVSGAPVLVDVQKNAAKLNELLHVFIRQGTQASRELPKFEFVVEGQLLVGKLGLHLEERERSLEGVVEVEYLEKLPPPTPKDSLHHDDWVSTVHASKQWLLTGCYDNTLHLWSMEGLAAGQGDRAHRLTIPAHRAPVKAVTWLNGDTSPYSFISTSIDQTAVVWVWRSETNAVECVSECYGHTQSVECVAVDEKKEYFATGSWDNLLKIWTTGNQESKEEEEGGEEEQEKKRRKAKKPQKKTPVMTLAGHTESVGGVAWTGVAEVATASWDHSLRVWDAEIGGVKSQAIGNCAFFCVSWSPFSRTLLTGCADRHIRLYDPRDTGTSLRLLNTLLQCPCFHSHRVVLNSQLLTLNVTTCDLPTLLAAAGVHPSRQHAVIRLTCAFLRKTGQLQRL